MKMVALRSFPYSRNGVDVEYAVEGEPFDCPDDIAAGLKAAKFVAPPDAPAPAPGPQKSAGKALDPATDTLFGGAK